MKIFTVEDTNINSFSCKYYIYSYKLLINSNIGICILSFMSKPDRQMQVTNVIKNFTAVIYRIIQISYSVCPQQTFHFQSNKHSSLKRIHVNYGQKSLITLAPDRMTVFTLNPWVQCYKTFYVHNLRMFVLSWSVCPWQAFPTQSNVCW